MIKSKTSIVILVLIASLSLGLPRQAEAVVPLWIVKVIQAGVKKVLKAIDLMVQRMQNHTIWLQNAQKVLENKLSQLRLSEIAEWTERQRQLYKKYYDELWKVKTAITTYKRLHLIIQNQKQLIERYQFTWHMINQDDHFTREEIEYMYHVYTGIIDQSAVNLDQILLVINSFRTQMADAKRLELIDKAGDRIEQNYADLREFNRQNIQLSLSRAKNEHEVEAVKKLYGLD